MGCGNNVGGAYDYCNDYGNVGGAYDYCNDYGNVGGAYEGNGNKKNLC